MSREVSVDGVRSEVEPNDDVIHQLLLPTLRDLDPPAGASRVIVLLAGPPAAGKSTLVELVRQSSMDDDGEPIDVVSMDGFHYPHQYLETTHAVIDGQSTRLVDIKGAPETFDVERLAEFLRRTLTEDEVMWPRYDRSLHDVVDASVPVTRRVVLVEGNWLLLDEAPWSDLRRHAAMTIFLRADPDMLRERLITRKQRGGLSRREAEDFYEASDGPNVQRCLSASIDDPDLTLTVLEDGTVEKE